MFYKRAQTLYDSWKHGKRTTKAIEKEVRRLLARDISTSHESDLLLVLSEIGVSY